MTQKPMNQDQKPQAAQARSDSHSGVPTFALDPQERFLLDRHELALAEQARPQVLASLGSVALGDLVTRLRARRDRARDIAQRLARGAGGAALKGTHTAEATGFGDAPPRAAVQAMVAQDVPPEGRRIRQIRSLQGKLTLLSRALETVLAERQRRQAAGQAQS